jgi:hypothetical protein
VKRQSKSRFSIIFLGLILVTSSLSLPPSIGSPAAADFKVFLPQVQNQGVCQPTYIDDFSNPSSGWPVGDDGNIMTAYTAGEFQVVPRRMGTIVQIGSGQQAENFKLTVKVRNSNDVFGSYGLMFGAAKDFSTGYSLEVYTDNTFENATFGLYLWDGPDQKTLAQGESPAVNIGASANLLQVVRNGPSISAYINGQLVASLNDSTFLGPLYTGIAVLSYDEENLDVRFDDFAIYPVPCPGLNFEFVNGETVPLPSKTRLSPNDRVLSLGPMNKHFSDQR